MKVDLSAFTDPTLRGYALVGIEALCVAYGGGDGRPGEWRMFNEIRKQMHRQFSEHDRDQAVYAAKFISQRIAKK